MTVPSVNFLFLFNGLQLLMVHINKKDTAEGIKERMLLVKYNYAFYMVPVLYFVQEQL